MNIKKMLKKNEGFTLAELLIVVAIIAVLVAVAIPTFSAQLEKSRQSVDMSNLRGAYAAGKIMAMDGAYTNQSNTPVTLPNNAVTTLWYSPETGDLLEQGELAANGFTVGKGYNKATKNVNVVADVTNLASTIGFQYTTEPTTSAAGALNRTTTINAEKNTALVKVMFKPNATTGGFDVYCAFAANPLS